jgi:hypothetical protein
VRGNYKKKKLIMIIKKNVNSSAKKLFRFVSSCQWALPEDGQSGMISSIPDRPIKREEKTFKY